MARAARRFTIYDALDEAGVFDSNPANPQAVDADGKPLYLGPVQYPKMLYHPTGMEKIIVPAEIIVTPIGPKAVGEQRELIYMVVHSQAEEAAAVGEGWHLTPREAILAGGGRAPAQSPVDALREAEAKIAALSQQVEALRTAGTQAIRSPGAIVPRAVFRPGTPSAEPGQTATPAVD